MSECSHSETLKKLLFKITSVSPDGLRETPFYKIDYSYNRILGQGDSLENQISREYTFVAEAYGPENRSILATEESVSLEDLNKFYMQIREYLLKNFYEPKENILSILYSIDGTTSVSVYDRYLTRFICENNPILYKLVSTFLH